jgi:DNA-binding MarR family transcriptional regulator
MRELNYEERVAIARLRALGELLPVELDRQLADSGISSFEFTLLEALYEAPEQTLRLSQLAARTNATLPRLSRVVSGLERKVLVVRSACAGDKRATNAILTEAGVSAYREALPLHTEAVQSKVLSGLGEGGAEKLAGLVYEILVRLDPDRKLAVTADGAAADEPCDADPVVVACPADPAAPRD